MILTDWLWSSLMVLAIVCLIVMWINCRKYARDVFVISFDLGSFCMCNRNIFV